MKELKTYLKINGAMLNFFSRAEQVELLQKKFNNLSAENILNVLDTMKIKSFEI